MRQAPLIAVLAGSPAGRGPLPPLAMPTAPSRPPASPATVSPAVPSPSRVRTRLAIAGAKRAAAGLVARNNRTIRNRGWCPEAIATGLTVGVSARGSGRTIHETAGDRHS
ncbi:MULTISPECIES: hypothetical protein [Nonomuraea]|uniref:Uncharacterized protein n=1 Tax=Nonomuraea mangrovi TaxID=2316207 RepID=A0ABW4T1D1_9ACTN